MEFQTNKNLVLAFYNRVIRDREIEAIDELVSDHYIQHSTMGKDGKAGLIEAIQYLKTFPKPVETKSPIVTIIEDRNLVMAFLDLDWMGKKMAVIDIFRVSGGKICEHWDVIQEQPVDLPIGAESTMVNGGSALTDFDKTDENKSIISNFYQSTFIGKNIAMVNDFLSERIVNHLSECLLEKKNFIRYLSEFNLKFGDFFKVLGQGNYVGVQSIGKKGEKPFVFNFIFRLENKKITEIWGVSQEVPDQMPHQNGMI
ncbi:MAG: nuclear transport factor 2 family protein [Flammeovirgaceae bacterium]|nr:nuclear transport factor 2 family protein [Flammeovirgaceae bacterium]